jgi:hypothetical protein
LRIAGLIISEGFSVMGYWKKIGLVLLALAGSSLGSVTRADCLDDQRQLEKVKQQSIAVAMQLNNCRTFIILRQFHILYAAFYRKCYAELGLTRLQAEKEATEAETANSVIDQQLRGC